MCFCMLYIQFVSINKRLFALQKENGACHVASITILRMGSETKGSSPHSMASCSLLLLIRIGFNETSLLFLEFSPVASSLSCPHGDRQVIIMSIQLMYHLPWWKRPARTAFQRDETASRSLENCSRNIIFSRAKQGHRSHSTGSLVSQDKQNIISCLYNVHSHFDNSNLLRFFLRSYDATL